MIARKGDVCGKIFFPYIASNKIKGKEDSYCRVMVKKQTFIYENGYIMQEYDVCEECKKEFDNWIKNQKRKNKDNK